MKEEREKETVESGRRIGKRGFAAVYSIQEILLVFDVICYIFCKICHLSVIYVSNID